MQRYLLWLVCLLAAVGLWLLQGGEEATRPPEPTQPSQTGTPNATPDTSSASPGPTTPNDAAFAASSTAREAVVTKTSLLPIPEDAHWIEVRIIDKATREPIAGAQVSWWDETLETAFDKQLGIWGPQWSALWHDEESRFSQLGWQTISDSRGIARIHQTERTRAVARHQHQYGTALLHQRFLPPRGGFTIALEPDHHITIQVLDAAGQPAAGVPVGVGRYDEAGELLQIHENSALAVTEGPQGLAVIRHEQTWKAKPGTEWRALILLLQHRHPGVRCEFAAEPGNPVVLQLPPCGSVYIRPSAAVAALGDISWIHLRQQKPGRNDRWRYATDALLGTRDADGGVHYPFVPLHADLHAECRIQANTLRQTLQGPTQEGQLVEVELQIGPAYTHLTGRLLDAERQPLASREFRFQLEGSRFNFNGSHEVRTDAQGNFHLLVHNPGSQSLSYDKLSVSYRPNDEPHLSVNLPGRDVPAGRTELGDIMLSQPSLLVGGRFLVDGEPYLQAVASRIEFWSKPRPDRDAYWQTLGTTGRLQLADGSFAIYGHAQGTRCRMVLPGGNHLLPAEPLEFRPGEPNLTVSLRSGHRLTTSMIMPECPGQAPVATLHPQTGEALGQAYARVQWRANGHARGDNRWQADWQALPSGSYRLELGLQSLSQSLVTLQVQLPLSPEDAAQLIDIDLGAFVQAQQVAASSSQGKPLRSFYVFAVAPDATGRLCGTKLANTATILLPKGMQTLWFMAPGHRPQQATATGADLKVTLDPWPMLELHLGNMPELPKGVQLRVRMVSSETGSGPREYYTLNDSGNLNQLTESSANWQVFQQGLRLPIDDRQHTLEFRLTRGSNVQPVEFRSPKVLANLGSVTLNLEEAAVQKALTALAAMKD
jgi:hypothetical protein